MSWTFDAPSGVYKNHALSSRIREAAIADAVFMQFARPERGYGKGRGESVSVTRIFPLPQATRINEMDNLPSGRPDIDTVQIEVGQWGFKIPMTEFEENLTHFNLRNQFQRVLRDQMRLTMDQMVADAMKLTKVKYIPQASGGTLDTDGTASTQADTNLSVSDLREMYDYLRSTLKAPPFRQGNFAAVLSTRAARGIKNDPEFKDWLAPTSSEQFRNGGLNGMVVEGIRLWESNHLNALDDDIGASGVLGEAIVFGQDPAVLATVMEPELRAGVPQELGTKREVGWVGQIDAGIVWDQAATARVIHVTSS